MFTKDIKYPDSGTPSYINGQLENYKYWPQLNTLAIRSQYKCKYWSRNVCIRVLQLSQLVFGIIFTMIYCTFNFNFNVTEHWFRFSGNIVNVQPESVFQFLTFLTNGIAFLSSYVTSWMRTVCRRFENANLSKNVHYNDGNFCSYKFSFMCLYWIMVRFGSFVSLAILNLKMYFKLSNTMSIISNAYEISQ